MADHGSYKSTHNASRHGMTMRRAREEDARRVAEREDDSVLVHETGGSSSARLVARGGTIVRPKGGGSGKTKVEVKQEGSISGRYSTRITTRRGNATTVRVAGGDTIIRYQSGDVVIKRGAKRAHRRNQAIWAYALGYIILFGLFVYWLLTGTATITPEQFVARAFPGSASSSTADLEQAAYRAMRGNRTPAEIRVAGAISFYDDARNQVHVEEGNRLTLQTAAKFGRAILEDQKRPPASREFREPIEIYKETYLAGINWPHILTLYNALGFFLLVGLFLWRPVTHYLGTQAKKTAVALRNARDAADEAERFREKYRKLAGEIEAKTAELAGRTAAALEKERGIAMERARRKAGEISGNIKGALENEERRLAGDIGRETVGAACDRAKELLRERIGQAEHDAAIDELIHDIAATGRSA